MAFCPKCGAQIGKENAFCSNCGAKLVTKVAPVVTQAAPTVGRKSEGIAVMLAILIGFIGFYGMGHLYVGRIRRGIAILLIDWAISIIGIVFVVILLPLGILFLLGSFALFIWQIFDAHGLARQWNRTVDDTGEAPW